VLGGSGFGRRGFVGDFDSHQPGSEFLGSVELKVDGGPFGVRLGYHPQAVLCMPDELAFHE